jgi:RNA polymerase sigma-70 factor (ECF subfamily)
MVQSATATEFRQLVETYQHKVYNQAYRMLGSREEAEEEFRGDAKLSSWIYRITANVCISRMRKKQMRTTSIDAPVAQEGRSVAETLADEDEDPEHEYAATEMGNIVREQLRRLKPEWAQAISLHYFGGQSYEEVAEAMEIPRATVATYIRRGKIQLAGMIVARTGTEGVYLK